MKLFEFGNNDFFIHLTYEEEQRMAQWTMDLLAEVWFDRMCGKVHRLVSELYDMKSARGKNFTFKWYIELLDAVNRWNDDYEKQISLDGISLEEDEKYRVPPTQNDNGREYSTEERIGWHNRDTRRAWREIWQEHRIKGTGDEFLVFPGDDPGKAHAEVQEAREKRFWAEVERRSREWSDRRRSDVIKAVSDYMPRGEVELPDPKGDKPGLLDQLEVEYPDPE